MEIDHKCIGCGLCFLMYPDIFDLDDDGLAIVKKHTDKIKEVIDTCPMHAIH